MIEKDTNNEIRILMDARCTRRAAELILEDGCTPSEITHICRQALERNQARRLRRMLRKMEAPAWAVFSWGVNHHDEIMEDWPQSVQSGLSYMKAIECYDSIFAVEGGVN